MSRQLRKKRRAFLIVNVLVALGLLGVFALAATRVLRLAVITSNASAREQDALMRLNQSLHALRADVWQAKTLDVPNATTVRLTAPDDTPITWSTTDDGNLVRTAPSGTQSWTNLGLSFDFQQPPLLAVRRQAEEVALLRRAVPGGSR